MVWEENLLYVEARSGLLSGPLSTLQGRSPVFQEFSFEAIVFLLSLMAFLEEIYGCNIPFPLEDTSTTVQQEEENRIGNRVAAPLRP